MSYLLIQFHMIIFFHKGIWIFCRMEICVKRENKTWRLCNGMKSRNMPSNYLLFMRSHTMKDILFKPVPGATSASASSAGGGTSPAGGERAPPPGRTRSVEREPGIHFLNLGLIHSLITAFINSSDFKKFHGFFPFWDKA